MSPFDGHAQYVIGRVDGLSLADRERMEGIRGIESYLVYEFPRQSDVDIQSKAPGMLVQHVDAAAIHLGGFDRRLQAVLKSFLQIRQAVELDRQIALELRKMFRPLALRDIPNDRQNLLLGTGNQSTFERGPFALRGRQRVLHSLHPARPNRHLNAVHQSPGQRRRIHILQMLADELRRGDGYLVVLRRFAVEEHAALAEAEHQIGIGVQQRLIAALTASERLLGPTTLGRIDEGRLNRRAALILHATGIDLQPPNGAVLANHPEFILVRQRLAPQTFLMRSPYFLAILRMDEIAYGIYRRALYLLGAVAGDPLHRTVREDHLPVLDDEQALKRVIDDRMIGFRGQRLFSGSARDGFPFGPNQKRCAVYHHAPGDYIERNHPAALGTTGQICMNRVAVKDPFHRLRQVFPLPLQDDVEHTH